MQARKSDADSRDVVHGVSMTRSGYCLYCANDLSPAFHAHGLCDDCTATYWPREPGTSWLSLLGLLPWAAFTYFWGGGRDAVLAQGKWMMAVAALILLYDIARSVRAMARDVRISADVQPMATRALLYHTGKQSEL